MPEVAVAIGIAICVLFGSSVAVSLGFGSHVLALPLASFFADVKFVLPVLATVAVCGSTFVALKERRHIVWKELRPIVL